ncbi:MAG: prevent-host-death family protein [Casimicrobium sp.]
MPVSAAIHSLSPTFDQLPKVTASALVTGMQQVTKTVLTQGAVVITKHDQPAMVLLSVERYRELEQASAPDLDALTKDFDAMYARMQASGAKKRMANAFAASPKAMGAAAAAAAAARTAVAAAERTEVADTTSAA